MFSKTVLLRIEIPLKTDTKSNKKTKNKTVIATGDLLPLDTVRAGDHCDRRMSKQILPLLFIFG